MKIYVCGRMTGLPLHNFPAFDKQEGRLRRLGHEVVNPANIDRAMGIDEYSTPAQTLEKMPAMQEEDLRQLLTCDAIFCMKGWEQSSGARCEHEVARWRGLRFLYEESI